MMWLSKLEATSTELLYYLQYFIFKKLYMVVLLNFTLFGPLGTVCTSNPRWNWAGLLPMMAYIERLHPKELRYMKG